MRKHVDRSLLALALPLVLAGAVGLRGAAAAPTTDYTIIPGGPPVTITITVPGENANVFFNGSVGQRVSLRLSDVTIGTSGCCSTRVSILKPDGTTLVPPMSVGTAGGFIDATSLPVAGSYRIFVDPQGTATGSATLTLYDVPADVSAAIVPGGPAVTVTTTIPGQNARLTFGGMIGQRVSLRIGPTCCSTKISLLKPDGVALVKATSFGTSGGFIDTTTLPFAGSYTIVVDPQSSAVGSVGVTLYDVPADISAAIVPGGPAVTVTTTTPGQNARLTFAGAATQRVSLRIGPSCCSTRISILKPDGTTLVAPTSFGTAGGFIDVTTLPVAGSYTIVVDPQIMAVGSVTLTLYDVPADISATIVPGGPAVTVTTTAPGQNARLTFDGTAGQRVSLRVGPSCCSTRFSILKPDGTTLVAPTTLPISGGFIDTTTLPVAGSYTIVVDPQSTAVGSITLTLYDVPADVNTTIVPGGAPVTVTATTPGQNARLAFGGAAGQRVSLNMTNVTIGTSSCCSTRVSILKPDGTTLVAPTNVGTSGGFIDPATLPVAGNYTIFVDPQSNATGSMTLTLYDVPADLTATTTPGGPPVTVTTTTPGQNGRVTFDGIAGRQVSLRVAWTPVVCCLVRISILQPDGGTLLAPLSVGATGAFIDARTLPLTGTYTMLVDPQGAATGTTTLTLYDVPPDVTAPIVPGGPAVTLTTTIAGQNARFTFTGAAGDGALVTIGPNCCATSVSILKPDGNAIAPPVAFGVAGGTLTARLPVAGTYTIFVDISGQSTGSVTARLVIDNTPPQQPVLTITEASPDSHSSGASFYYRPAGTGSTFTVNAATSDGGTGMQKVTFAGLSGGFTPTALGTDLVAPYSQTYNWTTGATFNGASNAVTAYDLVGNTSSATFAVVRDPNPPSTTDNTATIGSAWRNSPQTVTLSPTDAAAGVAATHYTTDGSTPTTGSPQGTLITLSADGAYTIRYFSLDNVGNAEAVRTAGTQIRIDMTNPTSTTTFPASGGSYNTSRWNTGCPSAGFCGTASDPLSGVQRVEISIRQGSGNYWDGSSFGSASEVFLVASGTATWSRPFNAAAFPADGSYTIRVRAVDNAGNIQTPLSRTFTYDTAPPQTTISSGPPSPTNQTSATFAFTSSETGSTFECRLDGAAFSACTSPRTYSGLAPGSHSFEVRATDPAGNTDGSPASHAWAIDTSAPDTTITSAPPSPTNQTSATFTFTASEAGSFQCRLDGAAFSACTTPHTYTGLAAGAHTFQVRAIDGAGNTDASPASHTWTIDTTAPQTTITSAPPSPTNQTSASFSFTSSETGSSFQCRLDGAAFSACASGQTYTGLAAGSHTFEVRATDPAGNTDASPATHAWTIDTTAPETTITSGPSSPTNQTSATFAFNSSETGSSFECRLDGAAFSACTTPRTYTGLAEGAHSFQVRATDPAGNTDGSPAAYSWTIDTTAPQTTITSGPPSPTTETSATFSFTSSETGSSFQCRLDGAAFGACTSPQAYTGLADGTHSFEVRATDPAGNTDGSPAVHSWTIDTGAPETTITSGPPSPTNQTSATFVFIASEAGSTFECRLDGAAFSACTTPRTYSDLAPGSHSFEVRATDPVGNMDGSPASHTWTIDTSAPETTISSGPPSPTNETSAGFSFTSSEAGSSFQCRLDGAAFSACASGQTYTGLAAGSHTFEVRATDPAGNTDASPAAHSWTIDTTAPETTITSGPPSPTNETSASFAFTSSEAGSGFECRLDGAAFSACASPQDYSGLAEGTHTFEVRATDPAGNTDGSSAAHSWTIDTTAPPAPVLVDPPDNSLIDSSTFAVAGTAEPGTSVEVFDDAASSAIAPADGAGSWTTTLTGVADGVHTYSARATDAAGNVSALSNVHTVTVDTVP